MRRLLVIGWVMVVFCGGLGLSVRAADMRRLEEMEAGKDYSIVVLGSQVAA